MSTKIGRWASLIDLATIAPTDEEVSAIIPLLIGLRSSGDPTDPITLPVPTRADGDAWIAAWAAGIQAEIGANKQIRVAVWYAPDPARVLARWLL